MKEKKHYLYLYNERMNHKKKNIYKAFKRRRKNEYHDHGESAVRKKVYTLLYFIHSAFNVE